MKEQQGFEKELESSRRISVSAPGDPLANEADRIVDAFPGRLSDEEIERFERIETILMKRTERRAKDAQTMRENLDLARRSERSDRRQQSHQRRDDLRLNAQIKFENRKSLTALIREMTLLAVSVALIVVGMLAQPAFVSIGALTSGLAGGAAAVGVAYRRGKAAASRELGADIR